MDRLHRSKHLWCLKRCKEASIDRSKTFGCLVLAYLNKQASISAQLLASSPSVKHLWCLKEMISKR
jgi:hypothetical protein